MICYVSWKYLDNVQWVCGLRLLTQYDNMTNGSEVFREETVLSVYVYIYIYVIFNMYLLFMITNGSVPVFNKELIS